MFSKHEITQELVKYTEQLVKDLYGNYVVQFILKLNGLDDFKVIIAEKMSKIIPVLSRQKYSSNVIEKCLQNNISDFKDKVIEVLKNPEDLISMIQNEFGNYGIFCFFL